jgi:hypothetical protein
MEPVEEHVERDVIWSERPTGQGVTSGGIGRRWRTRTADLYRVKVAL